MANLQGALCVPIYNFTSAGYTGGPGVNIQAVSFPGDSGESIIQARLHREILKKFIMVDVGLEPETQKTHGLSTTPFVKVSVGY